MILVTGATGNVGRPLVSQLRRAGADVRALTRVPRSAGLPEGVDVVGGDLSASKSLTACLDGVDTVFLLWPQATAEGPLAAVDVLTERARRIVYLSSLTVRDDLAQQIHPMTAIHADIERAIERSGLQWTFLRAGKFVTNTLAWATQIRTDGAVRLPYPAAGRSPIDERDIAAVAARVLTGDGHVGAKHVLTGPEVLTEAELVQIIGEASGRPARIEEIAPETARREMLAEGSPSSLADAALEYWAKLVGEPEPVTRTVEEVIGTPARTFRAWATEHADDFR